MYQYKNQLKLCTLLDMGPHDSKGEEIFRFRTFQVQVWLTCKNMTQPDLIHAENTYPPIISAILVYLEILVDIISVDISYFNRYIGQFFLKMIYTIYMAVICRFRPQTDMTDITDIYNISTKP